MCDRVVDIARSFPLAVAGAAGGGSSVSTDVEPGTYEVRTTADITLRDGSGSATALHAPVTPSSPLRVVLRSSRVTVAAAGATDAVVHFLRLVPAED